jgi:hypothetical protein
VTGYPVHLTACKHSAVRVLLLLFRYRDFVDRFCRSRGLALKVPTIYRDAIGSSPTDGAADG